MHAYNASQVMCRRLLSQSVIIIIPIYRFQQKEILDLEDKWKKAMMNNAQLDNEKQTYRYQVDLLKDTLEEMEEQLIELTREHRDRCRVSDNRGYLRDRCRVSDNRGYVLSQGPV